MRPHHKPFSICSWQGSCTHLERSLSCDGLYNSTTWLQACLLPFRDSLAASTSPPWSIFWPLVSRCSTEVSKQEMFSWDREAGFLVHQQAHQYDWDHPKITHTDGNTPCRFGAELWERLVLKNRWRWITWIWNEMEVSCEGGDEPTFIMGSHLVFCGIR